MTVAPYKDGIATNDHTYFGNGCNNSWGTDGLGGSIAPCPDSNAGGRIIRTADDEPLRNGTYYHFQAATSGTGGALSTQNTNAPDTFCPLGWQLPYSGTGGDYYNKSRSWRKLFDAYSITYNDGGSAQATKIKSYPFSYIYSGFYYWATGRLYAQNNAGAYWSSTTISNSAAYSLYTWSAVIQSSNTPGKAFGYTIRCAL